MTMSALAKRAMLCFVTFMKWSSLGKKELQELYNHRIQILDLPAAPACPHLLEARANLRYQTNKSHKHGASCKTNKKPKKQLNKATTKKTPEKLLLSTSTED